MLLRLFIPSLLLRLSYSVYPGGIYNLSIITHRYYELDIGFSDSTSSNKSQVYGVYLVNTSCPNKHCGFCVKHLVGTYKRTSIINSWGTLEGVEYSCPFNLKEFTIERCPSFECESYMDDNSSCASEFINGTACSGMEHTFVERDVFMHRYGYNFITLDFRIAGLRDVFYNIYLVETCYPLKLKNMTKIKMFTENEFGLLVSEVRISMHEYCSESYNQVLVVRCLSEDYCPTPVESCTTLYFDFGIILTLFFIFCVKLFDVVWFRHIYLDTVCGPKTNTFSEAIPFYVEYVCVPFVFLAILSCFSKCLLQKNKSLSGQQSMQPNGTRSSSTDPPPQTSYPSNIQSPTQFSTTFIGNHDVPCSPPTYEEVLQMDYLNAHSPPNVNSNKLGDNYKTEY